MANQDRQVKALEVHLLVIPSPTVEAEVAVLRQEVMIGSRLLELGMTNTVSYFLYDILVRFTPPEKILDQNSFFKKLKVLLDINISPKYCDCIIAGIYRRARNHA